MNLDAAMLSPSETCAAVVADIVPISEVEVLRLGAAAGRVCARTIRASQAFPRFDHSAVDGYAVRTAGLAAAGSRFRIAGRVAAGDIGPPLLAPGDTVRVATGAPLPPGADAAAMWELCKIEDHHIVLQQALPAGANIRRGGEDIAPGRVLVERRAVIDARHLAALAASGIERVEVIRALKVAIFSTGDELRADGEAPLAHQIHDANRPMLASLLASPRVEILDAGIVQDEPHAIAAALSSLAPLADVIVASGGAGGSDTDHAVAAIANAAGLSKTLRVTQRPGKRLVVGDIAGTPVIWLPGNTVAALVSGILYARPLLDVRSGTAHSSFDGVTAVTESIAVHHPGRTEFVPASIVGRLADNRPILEVTASVGPASLSALLAADGLVEIPSLVESADGSLWDVRFHPFASALRS